jgi:hypothetical protein
MPVPDGEKTKELFFSERLVVLNSWERVRLANLRPEISWNGRGLGGCKSFLM